MADDNPWQALQAATSAQMAAYRAKPLPPPPEVVPEMKFIWDDPALDRDDGWLMAARLLEELVVRNEKAAASEDARAVLAMFAGLAAGARRGGPVTVRAELSAAARRMLHAVLSRRLVNIDYGVPGRDGLARLAGQLHHELPAPPQPAGRSRSWGPGYERL